MFAEIAADLAGKDFGKSEWIKEQNRKLSPEEWGHFHGKSDLTRLSGEQYKSLIS